MNSKLYPDNFPSFKRGIMEGFQEWCLYGWMITLGILALISVVIIMAVLLVWAVMEGVIGKLLGRKSPSGNEDDY